MDHNEYRTVDLINGTETRISWGWIAWGQGAEAFERFNLTYLEPFDADPREHPFEDGGDFNRGWYNHHDFDRWFTSTDQSMQDFMLDVLWADTNPL
jgi:hypothetical protein